ncbi:MAG TPA: undecaprenyl-diphosphatase UppP [Kofleriaceae bacterium]|nr:undecaprenyl-diphosphatase UppP [Kofleriaceae bacterium]
MVLWFAALLGVVQGLTEFIPVSSSAHLRLVAAWLGQPDAGAAYTAVLQLGTLLAVITYFAKDLWALAGAVMRNPTGEQARLVWKLGLASVPLALAGISLESYITGDLRRLEIVASALLVVGFLLIVIDRRGGADRSAAALTWTDVLLIGCAQAAALVPGVSRSGSTICMALLLGMSRVEAARFSFLLSIPAVAGSGAFELRAAVGQIQAMGGNPVPALVLGTVISGVVGYASIAWFLRWLGTRPMAVFGIYRMALGALVLAALAVGWLHNEPASDTRAQSHVKNDPPTAAAP